MLDIKRIREKPDECEELLKRRDQNLSLKFLLDSDVAIRQIKQELESLKATRNAISKQVGELKRSGKDAEEVMEKAKDLGVAIEDAGESLKQLETRFHEKIAALPNLPQSQIPVSQNPQDNVCIHTWGEKPSFGFEPKNHLEIAEKMDILDFPRGAKLSGSGFPIYKGLGARLEWALLQYMIDVHTKNGFEMVWLPFLVRPEAMYGVGQLPKFESQLFKIHDDNYHLYLLPTAEAAICGMHADEIFSAEELPKRYVAYSPCFRREAGAHGEAERGLIRVHQFNKVEMFAFTTPEQSDEMMQRFLSSAQSILEGLDLHYRNMQLVTGDLSFSSSNTVDIEVYLPGQGRYYEVSSVSNCTDYQARRSKIRYKEKEAKPELVHTLNGSGVATARLLVALIENNQQEDGSFKIPSVLEKYL